MYVTYCAVAVNTKMVDAKWDWRLINNKCWYGTSPTATDSTELLYGLSKVFCERDERMVKAGKPLRKADAAEPENCL